LARSRTKRRAPRSAARATPAPVRPPETQVALGADRRPLLVGAGVTLLALVAYLLTAARDIFPGDSPEFITVALTGGVAHPPGYPLLSLLGVAFGELPLGPFPFRIGLISVLAHAATVGLVYLTAQRLTRDVWASAAAALLLAFGKGFWEWGLVAETFPLNDLLAAAVLYQLVVWREDPVRDAPLYGAAAALGLGFANQQTISLLIPAILFVLYQERRALRGRRAVGIAVAIVVAAALVPYAYVAVAAGRHAVLNWGGIESLADFLRAVLRLDYGTGSLVPSRSFQGGTGVDRMIDFAKNANFVLLGLAIAGTVGAYRRQRGYLWLAGLAFLFTGPFFIAYANANPAVDTSRFILARFYLLSQVVAAPLAAFGLLLIAETIKRRVEEAPPRLAQAVAGIALAVAALEVAFTYGAVDRSNDHVARNFAEDILATAQPDSIILADGDHVLLPLIYLTAVEGKRPDVTVVAYPLLGLDWYQRELRRRHPELNLPLARYDASDGLITFVRANPKRLILLTGEEADQSIQPQYGVFARGLTLPIVEGSTTLDLIALAQENEKLLASYRVPSLDAIDRASFERFIVTWYALVPYRIGARFEEVKHYDEARTWYGRALVIDPDLADASTALRRIQGK
jgi:dolichyl-phosphate-mannose-protein mannosyltransferase